MCSLVPHSEAKEQMIYNVNILGGSSCVLELLETIGNSAWLPEDQGMAGTASQGVTNTLEWLRG